MRRGGHELRELGLDRAPPRPGELEARAQQGLPRGRPEQHERVGLDDVELRAQPRQAGADLPARGLLVDAALAALLELEVLDGVGDVDLAAVDADGLERLVELAAGRAHEHVAGPVLTVARDLADHHHLRALQALAEDDLRRARVEVAAATPGGRLAKRLERLALRQERGRVAGVLDLGHDTGSTPRRARRSRTSPCARRRARPPRGRRAAGAARSRARSSARSR